MTASGIDNNLVSIIIPFYNAAEFIARTINSVLKQSYRDIELLMIDDGSEDRTYEMIPGFADSRIYYFYKKNSGVSDSRNFGIEKAKGKYILFLDADDILPVDFIEKRVTFLEKNPGYDACCSDVIKIDENDKPLNGIFNGAWKDVMREVLIPDINIVTCPSNYLFRKKIIEKENLKFNLNLSSSADRFFLVEFSKAGKIGSVGKEGMLYYRVHKYSMSNHLSLKLIMDNLAYYNELGYKNYVPKTLKKNFLFKFNYILAGGYFKLGYYAKSLRYLLKALWYDPVELQKHIFKIR